MKPTGVRKEILMDKISEAKQDNTWYDGNEIAVFEKGNRQITVVAEGEIRINIFNKRGKHIGTIGNTNIDDLERFGIRNDNDIETYMDRGLLEFENNGWFGLHCYLNDEYLDLMLDVAYSYDEAIQYAEQMIGNDEIWA